MTVAQSLETLEEIGVKIDLIRIQRDLAVQALHNIQRVDTIEQAQSLARGVAAAIGACGDDEAITITTRDYTTDAEEGCDTVE